MLSFHVCIQIKLLRKGLVALTAYVTFGIEMNNINMFFQLRFFKEGLFALVTLVIFQIEMNCIDMNFQMASLGKR